MPKKKYRSNFEKEVAKKLKGWKYESCTLDYTSRHSYLSDFSKRKTLIEVKGRFRTAGEAAKYLDIRRDNPKYKLVFLFMNPTTPMPNSRKRKDGTRYTVSEWAEKNNFKWFTIDTIKEIL